MTFLTARGVKFPLGTSQHEIYLKNLVSLFSTNIKRSELFLNVIETNYNCTFVLVKKLYLSTVEHINRIDIPGWARKFPIFFANSKKQSQASEVNIYI